jgi:hypothetical protein
MKLDEMLENVGLSFAGRKHSGIDDTKNIVRILIQIKTDGATPMLNEQFDSVAQQFYSAMMVPKKVRSQFGTNTGFRYNNPSGDSTGPNSGAWGDKNGRNTPNSMNKDKVSKWGNSKIGPSSKKVEPKIEPKTGPKAPTKPTNASDPKNQAKNERTSTTKHDSTSKNDSSSSKSGSKPNSRPGSRQSNVPKGKLSQSKLAEKVSEKPQQTSTPAKNTN